MRDVNNFCNAVQYSGASSDYMHMNPVYNAMSSSYIPLSSGYGSYGGYGGYGGNSLFNNTNINYTQNADGSSNYSYNQKPDRVMLGLGAAANIFGAISSAIVANHQSETIQQQQMMEYQAYQQQQAQMTKMQQRKQSQENMQSMFQMMMFMNKFNNQEEA